MVPPPDGSWSFRLEKRASGCFLRVRSDGVHTACNVSLPFVLTRSWPPGLSEAYGANSFSEILHLCPAAVFTSAHLEMNKAVFESQLCHSQAAGPWTTPFISQSRVCAVGMIVTALVLPGCCSDYVRMFIDGVWHVAALRKLQLLTLSFVYCSMDISVKPYQQNYHLLENKVCHFVFYNPRTNLKLQ